MPLPKPEPESKPSGFDLMLGVRRLKGGDTHGLFELVKINPNGEVVQLVDADTQAMVTRHMHMELMRI